MLRTLRESNMFFIVMFIRGTPVHTALTEVVTDPKIISDLPYLTKFSHSGELEVFHALCNMYCPKRFGFSYRGMYARTKLAVMDHNSGINRKQLKTKQGKLRYKTIYSRISSCWVARKMMEKKIKLLYATFYLLYGS